MSKINIDKKGKDVLTVKLNIDCVREILLAVEAKDFGEKFTIESLHIKLETFDEDDIHYCCLKLNEGGFLEVLTVVCGGQDYVGIKSINELTVNGHEFLENIREIRNFDKVKSICKKIGSYGMVSVGKIAECVISETIKSHFNFS